MPAAGPIPWHGSSGRRPIACCWSTTVETAAIMDAYASIKLLSDPTRSASIALVVNRAPAESLAEEAQQRLAQACRRFLGLPLRSVGHVPEDGAVPPCARAASRCAGNASMPGQPALRQVARAVGNHAPCGKRRRHEMRI